MSTYPENPTDDILLDRARRRVRSTVWFGACFVLIPLLICAAIGLFFLALAFRTGTPAAIALLLIVIAIAMLGVYRRTVSRWFEREKLARAGSMCHHCWYDLTGVNGATCPECGGVSIPRTRIPEPGRPES